MSEKKEVKTSTELQQEVMVSKKQYNKLVGAIAREYGKVESSSLKIAFALHEIYEGKYYDYDGFKNIYEFGEERFNLARGTVNNFINVIDKFAEHDESGLVLKGDEAGIIPMFEKFTFSKLCMLVSVPSEYWSEFYPSMTVKEIRNKKAEIAKLIEAEENGSLLDNGETEGTADSMNEPESDTPAENLEEAQAETDDSHKRCFIHIMSCADLNEMLGKFNNESFHEFIEEQLEAFKKELPSGAVPRLSIGLTYEN